MLNRRSRRATAAGTYKKIPYDTEVFLSNNTDMMFVLRVGLPRPRKVTFDQRDSEHKFTYEELSTIKGEYPQFFEKLQLLIVEVINDPKAEGDEVIEIDDVLRSLGLYSIYEKFNMLLDNDKSIVPDFVDYTALILDRPATELMDALREGSQDFITHLSSVAVQLFRNGEFGEYKKMKIIEGFAGEDLFAAVEATQTFDAKDYE